MGDLLPVLLLDLQPVLLLDLLPVLLPDLQPVLLLDLLPVLLPDLQPVLLLDLLPVLLLDLLPVYKGGTSYCWTYCQPPLTAGLTADLTATACLSVAVRTPICIYIYIDGARSWAFLVERDWSDVSTDEIVIDWLVYLLRAVIG
jgi:hypothetical protein